MKELQVFPPKPDTAVVTYEWMDLSLARAEVELARNQPDAAMERARVVSAAIRKTGLSLYLKRWDARAALLEGKGLLRTRRIPEALPPLRRAVEIGAEVYDPDLSPELADTQIALAKCLLAVGRRAQAGGLLARAKTIHSAHKDLGDQFRQPLRELEADVKGRY